MILALLILPIAKSDPYAFLFVLLTGVAGTAVVQKAERRIDLIKAGLYLSALNVALPILSVLLQSAGRGWLLPVLGWAFLNGFASSMISLGFLPILEQMYMRFARSCSKSGRIGSTSATGKRTRPSPEKRWKYSWQSITHCCQKNSVIGFPTLFWPASIHDPSG